MATLCLSATVPLTCGTAALVPFITLFVAPTSVDNIPFPGAVGSIPSPWQLETTVSFRSRFETATTSSYQPG
jgi:hypothetical protein